MIVKILVKFFFNQSSKNLENVCLRFTTCYMEFTQFKANNVVFIVTIIIILSSH